MKIRSLVVFLALGLASACDSDSGGGGGGAAGKGAGRALKGPVDGATVEVLELLATGALGGERGSGTTDASGAFVVDVGLAPGWAVVRVTGGTFVDEDTGANATIDAAAPLLGFVDVQEAPGELAVTPLTTIAVALAQALAHDPEATVADSVENALLAIGAHFGLADLALVLPADLTAGPVAAGPEADAAIVVAALSESAADHGVSALEFTHALARDAADTRFDGLAFGAPIALGGGTLAPTAATSELATGVADFLGSPRNSSGLTAADTGVDEVLAASTGALVRPALLRALSDGYGLVDEPVDARLEATGLPASAEVLVAGQSLSVALQSADALEFVIPAGLPTGRHDLVVRDPASGVRARLRAAIEVFDLLDTPTITRISPPTGPPRGGTLLRIEGSNLGPRTVVRVDGLPSGFFGPISTDFPRSLTIIAPPHAPGPVQIEVQNPGLAPVFLVDAFEYRTDDLRANPGLAPATTVFGAFRLFADDADGVTAQVLTGRATLADFPPEFSLADHTASEVLPAIASRSRSGLVDLAPESLAQAFRLSDQVNGLADFVRVRQNEHNRVALGTTDSGIVCAFPEPLDARVDLVARAYWVNGIEANPGTALLRQKTGWLELDQELRGSANLRVHARGLDGAAPSLTLETWTLAWNLQDNGSLNVLRTLADVDQLLTGRTSANADLVFLEFAADDGTLGFYLLTPLAFGDESGAFGGWTGGVLEQRVADDGLGGQESAFESGEECALVSGVESGLVTGDSPARAELAFRRTTRSARSDPAGAFAETVGARELDVTPSGRVLSGDDLVGYLGSTSGLMLALGEFPDGAVPAPDAGRALGIGGATFRASRESRDSIASTRVMVAAEAKLEESGAFRRQELATEMFVVDLERLAPPTVDGVEIALAGSLPQLAEQGLSGFRKASVRDGTGTVTTTRGVPPPFLAQVGFAVVDDELQLFATAETEPGGRFAGASFPRWIASGTIGNDGEVAALRGSDEFLGDGLFFLVALGGGTLPLPAPTLEATAMRLGLDFTLGVPSAVVSSRTQLEFDGSGTFAATTTARTLFETGATALTSTSGLGSHPPPGQTLRMTVPDGTVREWMTFWTPSLDAFYGFDDTIGSDQVELVLGMMPALQGGQFGDDERSFIGLELDPLASRATTRRLFFRSSDLAFLSGDGFTSRRDAAHHLLPARELSSASPTELGQGEARLTLDSASALEPHLQVVFGAREDAIAQGAILEPARLHLLSSQEE